MKYDAWSNLHDAGRTEIVKGVGHVDNIEKMWSDEARAAAAEARRNNAGAGRQGAERDQHASLHNDIHYQAHQLEQNGIKDPADAYRAKANKLYAEGNGKGLQSLRDTARAHVRDTNTPPAKGPESDGAHEALAQHGWGWSHTAQNAGGDTERHYAHPNSTNDRISLKPNTGEFSHYSNGYKVGGGHGSSALNDYLGKNTPKTSAQAEYSAQQASRANFDRQNMKRTNRTTPIGKQAPPGPKVVEFDEEDLDNDTFHPTGA